MTTVTIYYPEGGAAYTGNVDACNAASHIAANDNHAEEARALNEFRFADGIPGSLLHGEYVLQQEGVTESNVPYARYVRVGG